MSVNYCWLGQSTYPDLWLQQALSESMDGTRDNAGLSVIQWLRVDPTLTLGAAQVHFQAQLSASHQNLQVASWESVHFYPLFTDPSEGSSYPVLVSSPGPFLWHNYQPVIIESMGSIIGVSQDLSVIQWAI